MISCGLKHYVSVRHRKDISSFSQLPLVLEFIQLPVEHALTIFNLTQNCLFYKLNRYLSHQRLKYVELCLHSLARLHDLMCKNTGNFTFTLSISKLPVRYFLSLSFDSRTLDFTLTLFSSVTFLSGPIYKVYLIYLSVNYNFCTRKCLLLQAYCNVSMGKSNVDGPKSR
jgi:hypothetical protein